MGMDYGRALRILRGTLEQTPDFGEFLSLEERLLRVLEEEQRHGGSRDHDHERSKAVAGLQPLAWRWLGVSFNDLVFGRHPDRRIGGENLARLLVEFDVGSIPFSIPPPVVTRLQALPVDQLSWKQFELLCVAFVESQPFVLDSHLYGVEGDRQLGIDIVAKVSREGQTETWVYQCKRVKKMSAKELGKALDKVQYSASYLVAMLTTEASTALRDVAAKRPDTFLWDGLDISRKLKAHPGLVEDFFGHEWRRAFCGSTGF